MSSARTRLARVSTRARALSLALPVLIAAALAVAAGCGGDDGAGGGGDKVTVRYLTGRIEETRLDAAQRQQIEDFEKANPGIDVKREAIDNDQLRTIIRTRLNSPGGPTLFTYDTGPGFGGVLAKSELVQPLDDFYEERGWDIFPWARARATYGGKTYGVPDQVEEVGVFYNKTLFDEMGFDEPETLEELEAIAEAVKAKGVTPFAFANKDQWPAGHQFSIMVSNILGKEGLDEILYGEGKWNSPEVVKGIDIFFRQFEEKGYFPKDPNAIDYDDGNQLFFAGKAAMLPTGTWMVAEITNTVQFEPGFFPFPSIDGSSISPPTGVGGGWFVPAKAKGEELEATLKLIDYFLGPEGERAAIETFNAIPAHPVDTEGLEISPLFKEVLDDLEEMTEGGEGTAGYNIDVLTPVGFNEVMFTGFQEVLNGTRTPQEQADALQAAWEKAKAAGETLERP